MKRLWKQIGEEKSWGLPAIVGLGFLFRIFLLRTRFAVSYDEVNFIKLALAGAREGWTGILHTYWSPLYPAVAGLLVRMIPDAELAARMTSILFGTALIPLFYIFVKSEIDTKTARVTALLLALHPGLAFLSTAIMSESVYIFCMSSGIFAAWSFFNKPRLWSTILPGLCFGLAYLARPEGAGLVVLTAGLFVLTALFRKGERLRFVGAAVLLILTAVLIAFPYLHFLNQASGEWTLSAKGKANQLGEAILSQYEGEEKAAFLLLSEDNQRLLMDQIFHQGNFLELAVQSESPRVSSSMGHFVQKYMSNLFDVLMRAIPELLAPFWGVLIVLGLFGAAWSREAGLRNGYLSVFIGAYWFGIVPLFHINLRYLIPFLPFCLIWASQGFLRLTAWVTDTVQTGIHTRMPKRLVLVLPGLLLFVLVLPEVGRLLNSSPWNGVRWGDAVEEKQAGLWIREQNRHTNTHTNERPVIMSVYHTADFYAGNDRIAETVSLPRNELGRVLAYARHRGVNYLVLSKRYATEYPNLRPLFDGKNIPEGFKKIYDDRSAPNLRTVIYRIESQEQG